MFSLKIDYKRHTNPFSDVVNRIWEKSAVDPHKYTDMFVHSLFYYQLFQIDSDRSYPALSFHCSIQDIGVFEDSDKSKDLSFAQGSDQRSFAQQCWQSYFPKANIQSAPKEYIDVAVIQQTAFDAQIQSIREALTLLTSGGIALVENVVQDKSNTDYLVALANVGHHIQDYYTVEIKHPLLELVDGEPSRKICVLIKSGARFAPPTPKITIITPSCRPENLRKIKESIPMSWVDKWFIVYDGKRVQENPHQFSAECDKIEEYVYSGEGQSGNPQRNYALDLLSARQTSAAPYLYFLDDDNQFHPHLVKWLPFLQGGETIVYSFDQYNRIPGNTIALYNIDTAMVLLPYSLVKDERWIPELYNADGHYIIKCFSLTPDHWIYLQNDLCFYNSL